MFGALSDKTTKTNTSASATHHHVVGLDGIAFHGSSLLDARSHDFAHSRVGDVEPPLSVPPGNTAANGLGREVLSVRSPVLDGTHAYVADDALAHAVQLVNRPLRAVCGVEGGRCTAYNSM